MLSKVQAIYMLWWIMKGCAPMPMENINCCCAVFSWLCLSEHVHRFFHSSVTFHCHWFGSTECPQPQHMSVAPLISRGFRRNTQNKLIWIQGYTRLFGHFGSSRTGNTPNSNVVHLASLVLFSIMLLPHFNLQKTRNMNPDFAKISMFCYILILACSVPS